MTIRITPTPDSTARHKLADAVLEFAGGPLDGMRLEGFAIWARKNGGRNVTMPATAFTRMGARYSRAILRPIDTNTNGTAPAQERLRDLILDAYAQHEQQIADAEAVTL